MKKQGKTGLVCGSDIDYHGDLTDGTCLRLFIPSTYTLMLSRHLPMAGELRFSPHFLMGKLSLREVKQLA